MPPSAVQSVVLAIGDAAHAEFAPAVELLRAQTDLQVHANVDQTIAALAALPTPPAWIHFFQSLPGEFRAADCDRLWAVDPLLRVVRVLGSWCEGEIRTGTPWPGVTRMYWHQAPIRIAAELDANCRGQTLWGQPRTMSDDDCLLATSDLPTKTHSGLIAVCTRSFDAAESLADACANAGYATVWLQPGRHVLAQGFTALLVDFAHGSDLEFEELAALTGRWTNVPAIALLNFPRLDDRNRALQSGAAAILAKPLMLEDLTTQFEKLLDRLPKASVRTG